MSAFLNLLLALSLSPVQDPVKGEPLTLSRSSGLSDNRKGL